VWKNVTVSVLQSYAQIDQARANLLSRGLAWRTTVVKKILRRLGLLSTEQQIGDVVKSWDVLKTAEFAEKYVGKRAAVLDIGAFASEILIVLHRLGFQDLTGIDLNPAIGEMPYADRIRYKIGDFMKAPFADASFELITSISVIEHGYRPRELLKEVSRLLKPAGYFVASFDYWPEKIDTEGVRIFGLDWRIFSKGEVEELIGLAGSYGLKPHGSVDLASEQRPINYFDRRYTFAWLVLQKSG